MFFNGRHIRPAVLSIALLCFTSAVSHAQATSQEVALHGTLLDQNHSAVAAAQLVLQHRDSRIQHSSISDARGEFSISIAPGAYTLTAIADGFAVQPPAPPPGGRQSRFGPDHPCRTHPGRCIIGPDASGQPSRFWRFRL